jgi:hypothetical protein
MTIMKRAAGGDESFGDRVDETYGRIKLFLKKSYLLLAVTMREAQAL